MAEREIVLTISPTEEAALSAVLGVVCRSLSEDSSFADAFWTVLSNKEAEALGRVNAALNAVR